MSFRCHVIPVILETLLTDLAILTLRGLKTQARDLERVTLQLLALDAHLSLKLLLLRSQVSGRTGLSVSDFTFSEERRNAGVKWRRSWL